MSWQLQGACRSRLVVHVNCVDRQDSMNCLHSRCAQPRKGPNLPQLGDFNVSNSGAYTMDGWSWIEQLALVSDVERC